MFALLLFVVLAAFAGKILFGLTLEVVGFVAALLIFLIVFFVRRKKQ